MSRRHDTGQPVLQLGGGEPRLKSRDESGAAIETFETHARFARRMVRLGRVLDYDYGARLHGPRRYIVVITGPCHSSACSQTQPIDV